MFFGACADDDLHQVLQRVVVLDGQVLWHLRIAELLGACEEEIQVRLRSRESACRE